MSATLQAVRPLRAVAIDAPRPRVLHVSRVGFVGGAERVMLTLTSGLSEHGFDPIIACPGGASLEEAAAGEGVPVAAIPFDRLRATADPRVLASYPASWWKGSARLADVAERDGVRLIHAHHPIGALYARRAARRLGIPLVLHLHDGPPASLAYRVLLKRAADEAARVICVSRAARSVLEASGGDLGRACIVPNAVDRRFLDGAIEPAADVVGPGPHVGIFGVVEPRKGHDVFVEAAASVAAHHPGARFWIVGGSPLADKSRFMADVRARVAARGLADRVVFTGHRTDVPAVMKAMTVVVSASVSHESFGMVLAEAMALGRPVVTTAVGGTVEVVTDGRTGRVVAPRDPAALAAAIGSVLSGDIGAMARAAAAEARARFSPATFQAEISRLYADILGAGSP